MTRSIYNGFRSARPNAPELQNGWFTQIPIEIPDYSDDVYGGNVVYTTFRN